MAPENLAVNCGLHWINLLLVNIYPFHGFFGLLLQEVLPAPDVAWAMAEYPG